MSQPGKSLQPVKEATNTLPGAVAGKANTNLFQVLCLLNGAGLEIPNAELTLFTQGCELSKKLRLEGSIRNH